MPSKWNYHGDGVKTAVSTSHGLDGTLKSVRLQLDCFRTREWTEEEIDEHPAPPTHVDYDETDDLFYQHADGAHATIRFDVDDGTAVLQSITPEDEDAFRPDHIPLLVSAKRILEHIDGVENVIDPMETLQDYHTNASNIYIQQLDG